MTTAVLERLPAGAAADGLYYQCELSQGNIRTVGWIEARGARHGARVEIKGEDGLWLVTAVHQPPREITWLREKQRRDRGSLPSILGSKP